MKVLLVHGTWGRGFIRKTPAARWCRPDSMFVDRLLGELEERMPTVSASISPVMWCGSNSILRRAKAANDLKNQLESLTGEDPILIIGHSHGGNVVLQATSKLRDLSNIYVCTLATPFFRLFESDRRFAGARTLLTMFSIAVCIPVAVALFMLVALATEKLALVDELPGSLLPLFIIATVVIGSFGGSRLFELLINPVRARTLCEATFVDARSLGNHLLVLRGIDDEAALSLAAGAVTNRVLRIAYSFSLRLMVPLSKVDLPTIGVQLFAYFGPLSLIVFLSCILFGTYITFVGLTIMLVSTILSLLFIPLTRTVFGRELAFGAISCDAVFDSVPDSDLATIMTLGLRRDETFSHALYEHPLAPPTIANWIAGYVGGIKGASNEKAPLDKDLTMMTAVGTSPT